VFVDHGYAAVIESATASDEMSLSRAADNLEYETGLQPGVVAWAAHTWFIFYHGCVLYRDAPSGQRVVTGRQAPTVPVQPISPRPASSAAEPKQRVQTGPGTKAAAVRADATVWWCTCGMANDNSRDLCRACFPHREMTVPGGSSSTGELADSQTPQDPEAAVPGVTSVDARSPGKTEPTWRCARCSVVNTSESCIGCGLGSQQSKSVWFTRERIIWVCPRCSFDNNSYPYCIKCNYQGKYT